MAPQQLNVQAENAPQVSMFGPGGQYYGASLFGGFMLKAGEKVFEFFNISESSGPWAKVLTNLKEAGKIGSSMNFAAVAYAPRMVKVDGTAITAAEAAAMTLFYASSRVELYIGSNETKVAEYDLAQFLCPISGPVEGAAGISNALPINQAAQINLPAAIMQGLEPNAQIYGKVTCNLPTGAPAALDMDGEDPVFIWKWELLGAKASK